MSAGFRTMEDKAWDVSVDRPTLWLELDEKLYSGDGFGDQVDDLTGALEPLKNLPSELQRPEIWKIILADFASVETSFLRFRLKPGQIADVDAENPVSYDETYAQTRTIKIVVADSSGLASGQAKPIFEGSKITSCQILISPGTLKDPLFFTHVLVHEIMHCLGLEHQQDDSDSIMSYSNNHASLSIEERMGITHLYPLDPSYAKEIATFGMACKPAK